jgi:hypothetical protein
LAAIATAACCLSVAALAAISLCLLPVALLRQDQTDASPLGVWRQAFVWCLTCGVALMVFGMMPAEFISRRAQSWIITVLLWSPIAAIAAYVIVIAFGLRRHRRFQFSLLGMFGLMTAVAILALFLPAFSDIYKGLVVYPFEGWLTLRTWRGFSGLPPSQTNIPSGSWPLVLLQWSLYSGPLWGAFASITLIAIWFALRSAHRAGERFFNFWTRQIRIRWTTLARYAAKSAAGAAAVWLLLYLLVAPTVIRTVEDEFQYRMRPIRNPADHMALIAAARAEILASPDQVKAIRQSVGAK